VIEVQIVILYSVVAGAVRVAGQINGIGVRLSWGALGRAFPIDQIVVEGEDGAAESDLGPAPPHADIVHIRGKGEVPVCGIRGIWWTGEDAAFGLVVAVVLPAGQVGTGVYAKVCGVSCGVGVESHGEVALALAGNDIQGFYWIAAREALVLAGSGTAGAVRLGAFVHHEDVLVDSPCRGSAGEGAPHIDGIDSAIIDVCLEIGGVGTRAAGAVCLADEIRVNCGAAGIGAGEGGVEIAIGVDHCSLAVGN